MERDFGPHLRGIGMAVLSVTFAVFAANGIAWFGKDYGAILAVFALFVSACLVVAAVALVMTSTAPKPSITATTSTTPYTDAGMAWDGKKWVKPEPPATPMV